ncbi:MAG: GntR family transcriptional regulator [Phycisphaerae bacterium]|jgi:DNA-binding LacI/PurR family transcriptional regulator
MAVDAFENQCEKVYSEIIRMLHKEGCRNGDRIPPEREFVERFRVSRPTVSKALTRLIAEGVLCKEAGKKGTFLSSANGIDATHRDSGKFASGHVSSKVLKYVVPGNWGKFPVSHGVMEGIYSVGSKLGFHTQLEFVSDESDWANKIVKSAGYECVGLVIWGYDFELSDSIYETLDNSGITYVFVDSMPEGRDVHFVGTDNVKGAGKTVDYLVSLGHKKISYITEDARKGSIRDRLTGFISGLINHDIEIGPRSVIKIDENDESSFNERIRSLFETDPSQRPTAVFASHDRFLVKLCSFLNELGIKYPNDISLVGYDDIDISSRMPVPLTTIHQDFYKMGQIATEIIVDSYSKKTNQRRQKIMLEPQLVIRESAASIK